MMAIDEGDDTQLAITDDAKTTIAPDNSDTDIAELAWSADDSAPEVECASNRRPLPLALRVLLIGVLVAAVGLAAFLLGGRQLRAVARHAATPTVSARVQAPPTPTPQQLSPSTPQATKPPVVELPPPPSAPLTPDQVYLRALERRGIYNTDGDPRDTIRGGHDICDGFANGYSVDQVRRAVLETSPNATAFVDYLMRAAVNAYCPGYRSLLTGQ